jgi:glycosyltransferase involved in cell wall biosynthesis
MVQVNGGAEENWPRSGLEAMATGVPIVTENRWGWREMIRHGETGFLCNDESEVACYAGRLARDEDLRMEIACRARASLEKELAEPERIWMGWRKLFETLP